MTRVRVRRFLVKDRVLVRVEPHGALRGRYWIDDRIEGFDALVAAFEARVVTTGDRTADLTRPRSRRPPS